MELEQVTKAIAAQLNSACGDYFKALKAADLILNTSGVECIFAKSGNDGRGELLYEYCNTGDTYAPTLVYDVENRTFLADDIGTLIENNPLCVNWHESASQLAREAFRCVVNGAAGVYCAQELSLIHI